MRIAVTGGRYLNDRPLVYNFLSLFHKEYCISTLIHGVASGADTLSAEWAKENGIEILPFPAQWHIYGKYDAGFIRNQQMIDEGKPNGLITFPGHNGTADMTERAIKHGIEIWECKY